VHTLHIWTRSFSKIRIKGKKFHFPNRKTPRFEDRSRQISEAHVRTHIDPYLPSAVLCIAYLAYCRRSDQRN